MSIRRGDTVMVVRGLRCCGHLTGAEGKIFVVSGFKHSDRDDLCVACDAPLPGPMADGCPGHKAIDLDRLIKLPPESTPEHVEHREELTAS